MNNLEIQKVNTYYRESAWDYKYLWLDKAMAMHFGFYENNSTKHGDALLRMNKFLADSVNITASDNVVDAGCGLGGTSIWLAKNYGCHVTGLNIVPPQVVQAQQEANKQGVSNKVFFEEQDFTQTSYPENTFDVFWGLESIVHAPEKIKVVNEAYRLLKFKGRIVISEYMVRERPSLTEKERTYLQPALDGWAMPNLLTTKEYIRLMTDVGFRNIKTTDISDKVSPSLKRLKNLCLMSLPGAWILEKLGIFSEERFLNVYGSLRHANSFFKGLWRYIVITAEK